jgi:hypothetical protein
VRHPFAEAGLWFGSFCERMGFDIVSFYPSSHETTATSIDPETHLSFLFPFFKEIFSVRPRNNPLSFRFCMVYNARPSRDAFIHSKLNKEKTLMKTALVRILAIATLATSMSAFAAADEPKNDNAANTSATQQQDGCAAYAHKEKKQKKARSQRDDQRTDQEKEFDHVLMGYFG